MQEPRLNIHYNIEQLFRQYYRKLCNVANRILNDCDASEDIVQNVFIKLWEKKKELHINLTIEGYLVRATANEALNYLERSKRMIALNPSDVQHNNKTFSSPDRILVYDELEQRVKMAIEKLPPKCRVIFALNRFEDMKYREIAGHLHISVKTVENQMGIALERLREELKPYLTKRNLGVKS